jgi:bifunctional DNA-binding transcriptional regulator/antitoxin component of YhaV-PrlF toxin-antitoxin module
VEVEVKTVDNQGRIILPKEWRDRYLKEKKAIVSLKGDLIEIRPFENADLTKYFDTVEVDLKTDLSDWHKVRQNCGGHRFVSCLLGCQRVCLCFSEAEKKTPAPRSKH